MSIKYNNNSTQKMEEYFNYRENIEKRIAEIELFYEKHFDEPFVLNFEKGRLKLKKLLMNMPNNRNSINQNNKEKNEYIINSQKYNNIMTPSIKSISNNNILTKLNTGRGNIYSFIDNTNNANSHKNLTNLKNISYSPKYLNRVSNKSIKNFYKKINEINNDNSYNKGNNNNNINNDISKNINNKNNDSSDNNELLSYNIFSNKLISNFSKKEKDLKKFDHEYNMKETYIINNINNTNKNSNSNNIFKNYIDSGILSQYKKDKKNGRNNLNLNMNDNFNAFESSIFNDKKKNGDNNNIYNKYNNNIIFKKDNINSSGNEEENNLKGNSQLKEVSFKLVLDEEEYSLLVKEKAKRINPLLENY